MHRIMFTAVSDDKPLDVGKVAACFDLVSKAGTISRLANAISQTLPKHEKHLPANVCFEMGPLRTKHYVRRDGTPMSSPAVSAFIERHGNDVIAESDTNFLLDLDADELCIDTLFGPSRM